MLARFDLIRLLLGSPPPKKITTFTPPMKRSTQNGLQLLADIFHTTVQRTEAITFSPRCYEKEKTMQSQGLLLSWPLLTTILILSNVVPLYILRIPNANDLCVEVHEVEVPTANYTYYVCTVLSCL